MLNRVTMATDTLHDFVLLPTSKQKILVFLLSNRNLREQPLKPSHYFSYKDIAEAVDLKETSVSVLMSNLQKEGWIINTRQRKRYTPQGELEIQSRWSVIKVVEELQLALGEEIDKRLKEQAEQEPTQETQADTTLFKFDEKLWRQGGSLGWQFKNTVGRYKDWSETSNPPDAVLKHFS